MQLGGVSIKKFIYQASQDMASTLRVGLRSTVAKNAASLYVIQFANYLIPLIMVPYLVRALGPSGYGLVAFGQGLVAYFAIFADYGFGLSATRKISLERDDLHAVSRTASQVWVAKALLALIGFIILYAAVASFQELREISALILILYGAVIGNVLFPTWLFQGMEKMVAISVINLLMQLFVLIGVFTLVHQPDDSIIYAGLISSGSILSGLVGAGLAFVMFKLKPVRPSKRDILDILRDGWVLFLSMSSVSFYTAGNAFILGLLTNPTVVGYYSVAEKIVKAILGLIGPISLALYPRFIKMALESKALALQWGRKMLFLMGGFGLVLSVATFIGAPIIVRIILGPQFEPAITVMRILSLLLVVISINNILGIQLMLALKHDRAFMFLVFSAGLLNIILAIILAPIWQASGMAIAVVLSEVFIVIAEALFLQSKYSCIYMGNSNFKGVTYGKES